MSSSNFLIHVYSPDTDDNDDSVIFSLGPSTSPTELRSHILLSLGLEEDKQIGLYYFDDSKRRSIVLPFSSIYDFCCHLDHVDHISFRVFFYSNQKVQLPKISDEIESGESSDAEVDSKLTVNHLAGAGLSNDLSWENALYFEQYSKIGIHWNMLSDTKRCEKYREAIDKFGDFAGKIVIDVGCGTGFLSVLAAKAGAKKVFAIEASEMHTYAREVVAANGVEDVVEVVHSQVELLPSLPGDIQQVDIIISEWMGVFLLYESMLESVIYARDKWLKPDGLLYPAEANIYLAPLAWPDWWNERLPKLVNVSGVDLSPLQEFAAESFSCFPLKGVDGVKPEHILDKAALVQHFDLKTISPEQYREFECTFKFKPSGNRLDGFVTWFDVVFKGGEDPEQNEKVVLSTTPSELLTHWKQDVFLLGEAVSLSKDSEVSGKLKAFQSKEWRRHYEVVFGFTVNGVDQPEGMKSTHNRSFSAISYEKEFVL